MPFTLPTTPTEPSIQNPRVFLFYGVPKVGKSTLLSQLPGSYLIVDTEKGTDYIKSVNIKVSNITQFEEVLALVRKANIESKAKTGKPFYQFLAIDVIDMVEEWCEKVATAKYKETTVGKNFKGESVLELDRGSGYLWLRMSFKKYFEMIQQCESDYVIIVGHIRDKALIPGDKVLSNDGTFKPVSNEAVSFRDLDLTGKIKSIVCSQADAIGHLYRDSQNQLCINFTTNENVNCGSRCSHLKGQNFPFDWNKIYLPGKK